MLRFVPLVVCLSGACASRAPEAPHALPGPTVRRLTRAELDATLSDAFARPVALGDSLAAEDLQLGYEAHDDLRVTPLFADQLDSASGPVARAQAEAATCQSGEAERDCAKRVLAEAVPKLWRRPASSDEVDALLALYDAGRDGEDHLTGLALALQGAIEASGTLYRTELGEASTGAGITLTPWEIASELSFLATGGPPDAELIAVASSGALSEPQVRVGQLQRLLQSPRAGRHLRSFVEQWLGVVHAGEVQKNNGSFPKFDLQLRDTMAASLQRFIEDVLAGRGRVPELLGADFTYADDALAAFLGSSERPGPTLQRVSLEGLPRRGVLSHPALLSVYGHNDDGSPVLRGKLVRTRLLCEELPPPPPGVVAVPAPVSPTATTRQRAEGHLSTQSCRVCHRLMDPIGFGLEGFDGFGESRTLESGQPVDDSGEIIESDSAGPFRGEVELAKRLSVSPQVGRCATRQLARFAFGRLEGDADAHSLDLSLQKYESSSGSLYVALEGLVESDAFVKRAVAP
ncbi:MAG: DUF1592 domain-containing protein [Archangiaceae bacterium]|nr:DUF1592 domain-containing protein [Archangiaceae bacterium]